MLPLWSKIVIAALVVLAHLAIWHAAQDEPDNTYVGSPRKDDGQDENDQPGRMAEAA